MPANLENAAVATGLERSVFILVPKNSQTTTQLYSSHLLARSCSKFSKISFNSMWTENFQMYKLDLEKAEEPEIKLLTLPIVGSQKKQMISRKTSTSASLTMLEPLTAWITTNCAKFLKKWRYQTTLPAFWETCMQVKKQQNWTWNNRLVIKLGKEYVKAIYCHPAF